MSMAMGPLTGRQLWQPPAPTWRSRVIDLWGLIVAALLIAIPLLTFGPLFL